MWHASMAGFASHIEIGPNEFVETIGVEFDSLDDGLVIEHRPGFTFSWAEARQRALIAGDHAPTVVDPILSRGPDGRGMIPEPWVVSVVAAATTRAFGRVVANLAWINVAFPVPAQDGDAVFAESEILGRRLSRSRPDQGILRVATRALRRDGAEVCRFERSLLVYRSAQGPHRAAGYV